MTMLGHPALEVAVLPVRVSLVTALVGLQFQATLYVGRRLVKHLYRRYPWHPRILLGLSGILTWWTLTRNLLSTRILIRISVYPCLLLGGILSALRPFLVDDVSLLPDGRQPVWWRHKVISFVLTLLDRLPWFTLTSGALAFLDIKSARFIETHCAPLWRAVLIGHSVHLSALLITAFQASGRRTLGRVARAWTNLRRRYAVTNHDGQTGSEPCSEEEMDYSEDPSDQDPDDGTYETAGVVSYSRATAYRNDQGPIGALPPELMQLILGYLDPTSPEDIVTGRNTCSSWRHLWDISASLRGPSTGPDYLGVPSQLRESQDEMIAAMARQLERRPTGGVGHLSFWLDEVLPMLAPLPHLIVHLRNDLSLGKNLPSALPLAVHQLAPPWCRAILVNCVVPTLIMWDTIQGTVEWVSGMDRERNRTTGKRIVDAVHTKIYNAFHTLRVLFERRGVGVDGLQELAQQQWSELFKLSEKWRQLLALNTQNRVVNGWHDLLMKVQIRWLVFPSGWFSLWVTILLNTGKPFKWIHQSGLIRFGNKLRNVLVLALNGRRHLRKGRGRRRRKEDPASQPAAPTDAPPPPPTSPTTTYPTN